MKFKEPSLKSCISSVLSGDWLEPPAVFFTPSARLNFSESIQTFRFSQGREVRCNSTPLFFHFQSCLRNHLRSASDVPRESFLTAPSPHSVSSAFKVSKWKSTQCTGWYVYLSGSWVVCSEICWDWIDIWNSILGQTKRFLRGCENFLPALA